jgi:hypothetical protein
MQIDQLYPSRFLRCADLQGKPVRVRIANVTREDIGGEQKVIMAFSNGTKQLVLNKTNARTISKVLASSDTEGWRGREILLVPAVVDFRGESVDAIRVRAAPTTPQQPPASADDELNDDIEF